MTNINVLLAVTTFAAMLAVALDSAAALPAKPIPALRDLYKGDFLIGVAVGSYVYQGQDKDIGKLVARQFNVLTPENAMKWQPLNASPGVYTFDEADRLVQFAAANRMQVAGHTLVWHSQTPDWVFKGPDGKDASRELLLGRMRAHIQKVVGRYRGKVKGWDVVNEAVADGGKAVLRDSPWKRIIGEDFVEKAYQFAHEADPKAELYYNDYGLEDPAKRERALQLVKGLLDKGIPIHAVGNQAHWHIQDPPVTEIEKTLQAFVALGVKVNFTELDISLYRWEERGDLYKASLPDELMQKQAVRYATLFDLFRRHRRNIERVTFWGPTDKYSWLNYFPEKRSNHPLLFDRAGLPKPAFWAVADPHNFLAAPPAQPPTVPGPVPR